MLTGIVLPLIAMIFAPLRGTMVRTSDEAGFLAEHAWPRPIIRHDKGEPLGIEIGTSMMTLGPLAEPNGM